MNSQTQHDTTVLDLEDLLIMQGYEWILEEPFGEGTRILYRNGKSEIFIEHIYR